MFGFGFRTDPETDPPTTDTWADLPMTAVEHRARPTIFRALTSGPLSANWKNTGANSIDSRILGSNNPDAVVDDWAVVAASGAIAAGAMRHIEIAQAVYAFYRFQHQATVGGSQGASNVHARHWRL